MINNLMFMAALRGLTIAASSFLVGKGWVSGEQFETVVGAIGAIATVGYSIYTRSTNKQIADTQSLPKVAKVIKH